MRRIIEGGTDGGSMLLFDPGALPDDYDSRAKDDPVEMLEAATRSGDAFWINTNGDGGYLLHAFVNELPPAALTAFLRDEEKIPTFKIPSGRLYFAGAEYGFKNDDSFLRKYPHMGGSINLEPGVYSLSLFRAEYPEGVMEDELRRRISPAAYRLHESMGWFVMSAVLGTVCVVLSIFKPATFPLLTLTGFGLVSLPFIVHRLPSYRRADTIWREVQRCYPSIVAVLRTTRIDIGR